MEGTHGPRAVGGIRVRLVRHGAFAHTAVLSEEGDAFYGAPFIQYRNIILTIYHAHIVLFVFRVRKEACIAHIHACGGLDKAGDWTDVIASGDAVTVLGLADRSIGEEA